MRNMRKNYMCYIDFQKAFDSVWRKGLWRVMRHYEYPEKIVRILENAYKDTFSAVRVDGQNQNLRLFDDIISQLS